MNKRTKFTHSASALLLLFSFQISLSADFASNGLHKACIEGDYAEVNILLHEGVSLDDASNKALHNAAKYGHVEIVKILLTCGADANKKHSSESPLAQLFAEAFQITPSANTPLQAMSLHFHKPEITPDLNTIKSTVKELVHHGADPNVQNNDGDTPLHTCVLSFEIKEYHLILMKALLDNGANPFITNKYGDTPKAYKYDLETSNPQAFALLQEGENAFIEKPTHTDG